MKDRLVELIASKICSRHRKDTCMTKWSSGCSECEGPWGFEIGDFADHLLANGVIVPPCKVGDTVWFPSEYYDKPFPFNIHRLEVYEEEILMYSAGETEWHLEDIGKTVFLTKAEAEKALAERSNDESNID